MTDLEALRDFLASQTLSDESNNLLLPGCQDQGSQIINLHDSTSKTSAKQIKNGPIAICA
jgi:hypothetical protein